MLTLRHLALLTVSLFPAASRAAEIETFSIRTLAAQMRYDVTELTISPGTQVKIVFENTDDMPHNLVFFQPGTDVVQVCNQQMEKPDEALKRNWLPEDPRMWLHSKLLNPKEKDEMVFTAPEKTGIYPFVCTFPGHAVTMQGRLRIAAPGPKVSSLHFAVYLGDWKKLPAFSTLQPHREGELDGLVELKFDDYKNQFGVVYSGKLNVPKDGEYTFFIAGDDGVRLSVDGKKVVEYDGIHPASEIREGKVKLKAGERDFRLEYFQSSGESELYAAWSGADFALTPLTKWVHPNAQKGAQKKKDDKATGMPLIVAQEPVVYRNFITGAGQRSIGVGYPGAFNLAWSAEQMNGVYLWRGAFLDAARHWKDRGAGTQPPLGFDVVRLQQSDAPPFAVLSAPETEWPRLGKRERAAGFQWQGYTLDAQRVPTFRYAWSGLQITDRFATSGEALSGSGKFVRTLQLSGKIPPGAYFRAASGNKIVAAEGGYLVEGGKLSIDGSGFENRFKVVVEGAAIIDGKALLVPAREQIQLTYSWPHAHGDHSAAAAHAH